MRHTRFAPGPPDLRLPGLPVPSAKETDTRLVETDLSPVATADPGVRAGDRDRDAVTDLLGTAAAQGYLTAEEHGERADQALRAATLGELRAVVADLPAARLRASDPARLRRQEVASRQAARAHLTVYAGGVLLMLGIWAVTAVLFGATYFWPIWPILGWGIGVASHAVPSLRPRMHPALAGPPR